MSNYRSLFPWPSSGITSATAPRGSASPPSASVGSRCGCSLFTTLFLLLATLPFVFFVLFVLILSTLVPIFILLVFLFTGLSDLPRRPSPIPLRPSLRTHRAPFRSASHLLILLLLLLHSLCRLHHNLLTPHLRPPQPPQKPSRRLPHQINLRQHRRTLTPIPPRLLARKPSLPRLVGNKLILLWEGKGR
jgi:hypothetical protein